MQDLKQVLIERDEMTEEEANETIIEIKNRMYAGENPEELLYEIGLELDYIMDLFD